MVGFPFGSYFDRVARGEVVVGDVERVLVVSRLDEVRRPTAALGRDQRRDRDVAGRRLTREPVASM
jgi:hypothetical protein